MKCVNCKYDNNENARFCQSCGTVLIFDQNPIAGRMIQLLKDNLFMTLCILYSVSVGFSLVSVRIPIIGILMTIFLWLIFSQSKNGNVDKKYMRYISGTLFAMYITKWILYCMTLLGGIILAILSFSIDAEQLWNLFGIDIESYIGSYLGIFRFLTNSYLLLLSGILIVRSIIGLVFNGIGRRSIHHFAQSLYRNLEDKQVHLIKCRAAQNWLIAYGILNAIYAISDLAKGNIAVFIDEGCCSAVFIIGSILIHKYFDNFK